MKPRKNYKNIKIVLASRSPRRINLLKKIVRDFIIYPADIDEGAIKEKNPVSFAVLAATLKAQAVAEKFPRLIVAGADTIVVFKNKILGKPRNYRDGKKMLSILSGNTHEVITGLALCRRRDKKLVTDYAKTEVNFKKLKADEITDYLGRGDFRDKAGSYAIQDLRGQFIKSIKGDYDNVVGFPGRVFKKLLKKFNETSPGPSAKRAGRGGSRITLSEAKGLFSRRKK
jgi:septum formation protein